MSDSLWTHEQQHIRLSCVSLSPWVCSDSCPLSQWCYLNHLILFHPLLLPSIFPSISVFSNELAFCIRWSKDWSFSFSVNPSDGYSGLISFGKLGIRLTGLISLLSKGLSRVFSSTTIWKHHFFGTQPSLWSNKSVTVSIVSPSIAMKWCPLDPMIFIFWTLSFKLAFSLFFHLHPWWASLVAQMVKRLPAMWQTWVRSLGWEDPLEKGMATHSSILAWRISWTEEPGGLQLMGLKRAGQDLETEQQ